jgi:hypothetical protein
MSAPLITRRAALARAFKFASVAAIAAAAGYDLEPRAQPSTPAPAPHAVLDPPPTPASTVAPYVTPESTATPRPAEVRLAVMPTQLAIPSLGIDAPVWPAQTAAAAEGGYELLVPESGLVSPNHLLGDQTVNNIWILGHSRWRRVPQLLYTVADLNVGDPITVTGRDLATDSEMAPLTFEVDRLILVDVELAGREIYEAPRKIPRLIIQTSVRQLYDPEWILDRAVLEAKAEVAVTTSVDDLSRYLLLLVVAEVQEETLAALLANA